MRRYQWRASHIGMRSRFASWGGLCVVVSVGVRRKYMFVLDVSVLACVKK